MSESGTEHSTEGIGTETRTYCPEAGKCFGPHPEAFSLSPYCPYCGENVDENGHRVHDDGNEVMCPNTGQSTFRFCPFCGERTDKTSTGTDQTGDADA